jgi:uncharacterized protein YvpB
MIKKFKSFVESISGWELVGKDMGPNYPQQKLQNTINKNHTTVINGIDDNFYTVDDYLELYNNYLKSGNPPIEGGFNKKNLDIIITSLN